MNVLITGGSGALGTSLRNTYKTAYAPGHKEMDITDLDSVKKTILSYKPKVLIHTAAFVDVRGCEDDKERAWKTNVEGTQNIINALKELKNDCYLIYLSTACVFAGEDKKYYTEDDVPSPKNYYAFTKLCGELVARQYNPACIIRTNFVAKVPWKYPKAFTDRFGTYLFSDGVAKGISEVIREKKEGIIHIVGDKRISMHELAVLAGSKDVGEMTSADYEGPALTMDMSLSTKKWKKYKI